MKTTRFTRIILVFALFLLTACSQAMAEPVVEPTDSPTQVPLPEPTLAPTVQPAPTLAPAASLTPVQPPAPGQKSTPTTVVNPQNGWKGWQTYRNDTLGFSFQYPPAWRLTPGVGTMKGHSVILLPNTSSLAQVVVAFKRTTEDAFIGRTGLGGGELIDWGRVLCLGKESQRAVLVSEGKHMTILYQNLVRGELTLNISVDYLGSWGDPAGIPDDVAAQADAIVASLAYDHPIPPALTVLDAGLQIQMKMGETLTVTLEGNPTTGFNWLLDPALKAKWTQVGEPVAVPASDALGASAMITLKFQAVQPGVAPFKLVYARSWEKDVKPEKIFEATVVVLP
jgi:inhibitor of cysteine peptidase